MNFVTFMASVPGRLIRIAAGFALLALGLSLGTPGGWVLAGFALLPIAAGAFNFCGIAPLLGAPILACNLPPRQTARQ